MDIKELLRGVVDNIINEDEDAAKASFKQYALTKVQSIVEADSLSKKAKKVGRQAEALSRRRAECSGRYRQVKR